MPGSGNRTNSTTRSPSAAPPPPSLDELLAKTDDEISHMSISALKMVLFQNHVNARLLLEKGDLVARVQALLGDERQERAREAAIHAREEEEARQDRDWEQAHSGDYPLPKASPPPMMGTAADLERNGLCVVCQDEEANIAIVDCGFVFFFFFSPHMLLLVLRMTSFFVAIWQCAAIAQILSCPHPESAHFAAPVSSRRRAFYAYSNHNVVYHPDLHFSSIASSSMDPTRYFARGNLVICIICLLKLNYILYLGIALLFL